MNVSKNIGPFLAFSKGWFQKHQRGLLWLCNAPIIKYWFRWILRVQRDIPIDKTINSLLPNCITYGRRFVDIDRVEQKTDFRTHPKFAKRIYFAFKPLWWSLHYWDALFADRLVPQWSFGFLTLTTYPDPNPETTTVDGFAERTGVDTEAWATIIAGAGNAFNDSSSTARFVRIESGSLSGQWNTLTRGIFLFNTSTLGATAVVSAATCSLSGSIKVDDVGWTPDVNLYSANPVSNTALANGSYGLLGSTAFSTAITYAAFSAAGYNDFVLNASGLAAISLTGVTKLGTRNANYDVAAVSPTGAAGFAIARLEGESADTAGTTSDPKLVITYTLPVSGSARKLLAGGSSQMLGGRLGSKRRLRLGSYD